MEQLNLEPSTGAKYINRTHHIHLIGDFKAFDLVSISPLKIVKLMKPEAQLKSFSSPRVQLNSQTVCLSLDHIQMILLRDPNDGYRKS